MPPVIDRVIDAVGTELGVSRDQLLSPTRSSRQAAWARQIAVHVCHRMLPDASWSELGRHFGRDRTTVRHANDKVDDVRGQGDDLNEILERIERVCAAAPV